MENQPILEIGEEKDKEELYYMPQWQSIYKLHPVVGAKILRNLSPLNFGHNDLCSIVLHHHENWDGSGFPKGLKNKEIPVGARILRVADALIRKIDTPPQGEGKSLKDALFEMLEGSKKFFDPKVIAELLNIEETIMVWLNLVEENEKTELTWNNLGDKFNGSIKENTCYRG
ncbi:MAG: HD domain-containing phosphohydrolase [Caldimicrobium sp.]